MHVGVGCGETRRTCCEESSAVRGRTWTTRWGGRSRRTRTSSPYTAATASSSSRSSSSASACAAVVAISHRRVFFPPTTRQQRKEGGHKIVPWVWAGRVGKEMWARLLRAKCCGLAQNIRLINLLRIFFSE